MSPQAKKTDTTEAVAERIRELNERILGYGRNAGLSYLEAYESTLKTFADYQEQVGGSLPIESLASLARAQASFTRDVVTAYAQNARTLLK
jgi:hypothetical protein